MHLLIPFSLAEDSAAQGLFLCYVFNLWGSQERYYIDTDHRRSCKFVHICTNSAREGKFGSKVLRLNNQQLPPVAHEALMQKSFLCLNLLSCFLRQRSYIHCSSKTQESRVKMPKTESGERGLGFPLRFEDRQKAHDQNEIKRGCLLREIMQRNHLIALRELHMHGSTRSTINVQLKHEELLFEQVWKYALLTFDLRDALLSYPIFQLENLPKIKIKINGTQWSRFCKTKLRR